jgi:hypothetical protein
MKKIYVGDNSLNWHNINYISDMWNYEKKNARWWLRKVVESVRKFVSSDNRA